MTYGSIGDQFESGIVIDIVMPDHTAMAMRCVFAQTDVRDQQQIADVLTYGAECILNDSGFVR